MAVINRYTKSPACSNFFHYPMVLHIDIQKHREESKCFTLNRSLVFNVLTGDPHGFHDIYQVFLREQLKNDKSISSWSVQRK